MNFRIVKLSELSGSFASIYSVILEEDEASITTLFDHFLDENKETFHDEVKDIARRLKAIGQKTGARDIYFKEWEGKPGDGVCALFDDPDKKLRLYCIRFGTGVLVVGGGGHKPKTIRALQEDDKLTQENDYMKIVSHQIAQRIKERELKFSDNEIDLEGDFNFYDRE